MRKLISILCVISAILAVGCAAQQAAQDQSFRQSHSKDG